MSRAGGSSRACATWWVRGKEDSPSAALRCVVSKRGRDNEERDED